jgi:hypothetical protein
MPDQSRQGRDAMLTTATQITNQVTPREVPGLAGKLQGFDGHCRIHHEPDATRPPGLFLVFSTVGITLLSARGTWIQQRGGLLQAYVVRDRRWKSALPAGFGIETPKKTA